MMTGTQAASAAGLVLLLGRGLTAPLDEPPTQEPPLSFSAESAAITVDVVVLDDDDRPVRGLTAEDFSVFEDGKPQSIVGFEARDLTLPVAPSETSRASVVGASNEGVTDPPGRVFALLIDDLGLQATTAGPLKAALVRWLRFEAHPRDDVTIMTTSGDLWWSDVVGRGLDELVFTIESVEAKQLMDPTASGGMTEWEAHQITNQEHNLDGTIQGSDRSRPADDYVYMYQWQSEGETVLDRVVERWLSLNLCIRDVRIDSLAPCRSAVQSAAHAAYEGWRRRGETVYRAIGRLSRSLAGIPGRKSILLVSERFLEDTTLARPFRDALDATQRANTAIYFLGALGITGDSVHSVTSSVAPREKDIGALGREEAYLSMAGGETLAEATGGALTRSNDLAAGLERMASESSVYYLLGYQPEEAPDGKWHDLKVEVARKGVSVRARRSYLAARPEDLARVAAKAREEAAGDADEEAPKRPIAEALLAGSVRGGLPLRLSSYVGEPGKEGARVQVVLEVDNERVHVNRQTQPWRALLDVTVMAARVGGSPVVPVDERVDLSLGPKDVGNGWWLMSRDAMLGPGIWQLRAHVRDLGSGRSGLVTQRVSVPDVDQPYLSSLLLTDRTLPPERAGEPRRLVPAAERRFGGRGDVICQYEVFGFGGRDLEGVPQLYGGYTLQRAGDDAVKVVAPTPIGKAGQRAVRRIVLPLRELEDGRYVMVVTVQDKLAQRTLVTRESFVVERRPAGD